MKKLVVITGATSGIGLASAHKFASLGHPLLLIGRRLDKLNLIKTQNTILAQLDVYNLNEFKLAVRNAEKIYGDVDLMVNNAGVMYLGDVYNQSASEWTAMVNTNITGVINGTHIALETMKKNKTGTIINLNSVAGKKAVAGRAVYNATKFAIGAFSEAVRQEVATDFVRVISLGPGYVSTEIQQHTTSLKYQESLAQFKESVDGGLSAEEIADIIATVYNLPQHINFRELTLTHTKQLM